MVCLETKLSLVKGITQHELAGIAAASGEGMVSLDRQGLVLNMNAEAERLLGWQAEELLGEDFFSLAKFALKDIASLNAGSPCPALQSVNCPHLNVNARIARKSGEEIPISFMLTTLFDEGRVAGKLFIFHEEVKAAEDRLPQELVDTTASILVKLDYRGEIVYANPQAAWLRGITQLEKLLPESITTLLAQCPNQLDQQTLVDRRWLEGQKKELCIVWSVAVLRDDEGTVTGAICSGNDFTDHHHTLKGLLHESLMTQKVFEHINDGVIAVNPEGLVEYLNPVAENLTGWRSEEARGQPLKEVYHVVDEETLEGIDDPVGQCLRERIDVENQANRILLRRGGWEFIVQDSATPVHDAEGNIAGAVVVFSDVSELRGMERWMEYESNHDTLTGLINRRQFEARLREAMERACTDGRCQALLYMDLDQFKLINDSYGHAAGDQLLKEISDLLASHLNEGDSLARLGGDEFGIILSDCSLETAKRRAKSLCRAVHDYRFSWEDKPFVICTSIGLVPISNQWKDLAEVMRVADSACYVAKEHGRNRVHVFEARDLALRQRDGEMQWVERIRQALSEDRFRLYCQNIVPISKDPVSVPHYEILLRMLDHEGNVLRPAAFICAAERYNLMPTIDRWVIANAFKLLSERRDRGDVSGVFSINISGQSLDEEDFLHFVVDQLDRTDVPAENICFEITETTAASSFMVVQQFISVLRGMGCRFALDDFGRGISSFAYLKNLKVDYLKIDGMFVRDLHEDKVGHAMVESINHIGHVMGVQTIAEFVESQEVLEALIGLGVDHVQGYQLGRPRPLQPAFRPVEEVH